MAKEIERKFTLKNNDWKKLAHKQVHIRQGYLVSGHNENEYCSVRVRIADDKATLNIKSARMVIERDEYEYSIPLADAEDMLDKLTPYSIIEKVRYYVSFENWLWEIDVFEKDNQGLEIAEVELQSADEPVILPDWIGEEVSDDIRYYNNYLITHPYNSWLRLTD